MGDSGRGGAMKGKWGGERERTEREYYICMYMYVHARTYIYIRTLYANTKVDREKGKWPNFGILYKQHSYWLRFVWSIQKLSGKCSRFFSVSSSCVIFFVSCLLFLLLPLFFLFLLPLLLLYLLLLFLLLVLLLLVFLLLFLPHLFLFSSSCCFFLFFCCSSSSSFCSF